MRVLTTWVPVGAVLLAGWVVGCATSADPNVTSDASDGTDATDDSDDGSIPSGGTGAAAGGSPSSSTGGTAPASGGQGGAPASAGSGDTGGSSAAGGTTASGGSPPAPSGGTETGYGGELPNQTGGTGGDATGGTAAGGMASAGMADGGSAQGGASGGQSGAPAGGMGGSSAGSAGAGGSGGGSSGAPNLFQGSSFEGSTTEGWYARGTATIALSTEQARTGSKSLLVSNRSASWHGVEYDVRDVVTAGASYRVTVWGRLTSGTNTLILTRELQGCSGEDQFVRLEEETGASASAWVELSGTLLVPVSCSPSKLAVYVESPDKSLSYYIDDVRLEALE